MGVVGNLRVVAAAFALGLIACSRVPPGRSAIDVVEIHGTKGLSAEDVADHLATAPSSKFLGLFRGVVYDYEVYDPTVLQRDLARVERYYRGKGYFEAHARAARVEQLSSNHVRVDIVVEEGPSTTNRDVRIDGLDGLPADVSIRLQAAARHSLPLGARFDEAVYDQAKTDVTHALTDLGYAWAKVDASARVDLGARSADYTFTVVAGPVATFGAVTITGLAPDGSGPKPQEIEEAPLRRAIDITPGERYSTAKVERATQALLELQVFSAVDVKPTLPDPPPNPAVVPVTIATEPAKLRQVRAGGGAEFDGWKTELHLLVGWEDHNFLGGLRDFSVDFSPGVVLYPTTTSHFVAPTNPLPEEKLKLLLRQPAFLEPRTTGFINPTLNVTPLPTPVKPSAGASEIGFVEGGLSTGVDRPFGKLTASLSYNAQVEVPVAYIPPLDPALSTIVLSFPQLITKLDLRDDAVQPHKGVLLTNSLQVAGGPFGGDARDIKVQPAVAVYVPISRRVTLAARFSIGLMSAANYEIQQALTETVTNGNRLEVERNIEIMYFRGFYSGGANSNRGYPLRGIAPHGYVPFLNPALSQQAQSSCGPANAASNTSTCSIPVAGLSLWESSIEARWDVAYPFSTAAFCDAGDVSPREMNIRLYYVHLSCGVGARYETPVGPIRLDIGYRIQPLQVLGQSDEVAAGKADPLNGTPPTLLGIPVAIAFGIGEAF